MPAQGTGNQRRTLAIETLKKTKEWKKAAEQWEAPMALRTLLFSTLAMTLQERVTRLSTPNDTSEIWKEAMDHQVIDNQGSWPFLELLFQTAEDP